MKKKGGAVLIGFNHFGEEAAEKVIAELEARGIKKGDLVAVERDEESFQVLQGLIETGALDKELLRLEEEIKKLERQIRERSGPAPFRKLLQTQLWEIFVYLGTLEFDKALINFLTLKGVRILPLESRARAVRIQDFKHKLDVGLIFGRKLSWKDKVLTETLVLPVREKAWRRKLQGKKPRFVIAGAGHLPALKRMVPYSKAINLSQTSKWRRMKARLSGEAVRAHYRTRREWRKFKRRTRQKPRA